MRSSSRPASRTAQSVAAGNDSRMAAPTSDGVASLARVAAALQAAGIEVDDLGLRQPTLDEVFLTLTGSPAEDQEAGEQTEEVLR